MDYLNYLNPDLKPFTKVKIHVGTQFYPGKGSSSNVKDLSLLTGTNPTGSVPGNFFQENSGHLYQIRFLKSTTSLSGFQFQYKIGNYNQPISADFQAGANEIIGYEDIQDTKIYDTEEFATTYFSGVDPKLTFNRKPSEYTNNDLWIFSDQNTVDISRYLVSCSQFSFQSTSATDQFTYLGNTLQVELLKSIDGDRAFDPNYDNNYFFIQNWPIDGYRAKLEIESGLQDIESPNSVQSFLGYVEDISETRDTIIITLGDGIYKAKETYAHNIGILEEKRDLRKLGELLNTRIAEESQKAELSELIYNSGINETKFETYFKPIVKGFNGQKLLVRPNNLNSSEEEYEAEIVNSLNLIGKLDPKRAVVDYNKGIIDFEVPPIKTSNQDQKGTVYFTFKHSYKWKHPKFLAKKLFRELGYSTNNDDFLIGDDDYVNNDEGRVFSKNGRVFLNTGEREKEITNSICYVENDPATQNQNNLTGSSSSSDRGDSFYFGIGNYLVQHNVKTGEEQIIYKSLRSSFIEGGKVNRSIFKILHQVVNNVHYLIWMESDGFSPSDKINSKGADSHYSPQVDIYRLTLNENMNTWVPLVNNYFVSSRGNEGTRDYSKPSIAFENDLTTEVSQAQLIYTTPSNTLTSFKNKTSDDEYDYIEVYGWNNSITIMGATGNKDYSNTAYLKDEYLYFILQYKNYFHYSFTQENNKLSSKKKLDSKSFLIKLDITKSTHNFSSSATGHISTPKLTGDKANSVSFDNSINNDSLTVVLDDVSSLVVNDLLILSKTTKNNQFDGLWKVNSINTSSKQVVLHSQNVSRLLNTSSSHGNLTATAIDRARNPEDFDGTTSIEDYQKNAYEPPTIFNVTNKSTNSSYNYLFSKEIDTYQDFFDTDSNNDQILIRNHWENSWGKSTQNKLDFFVDDNTSNPGIYIVSVTGDSLSFLESKGNIDEVPQKIKIQKIRWDATNNNNTGGFDDLWTSTPETFFSDIYNKFFEEGNRKHRNRDHKAIVNRNQYIPYDIWGICAAIEDASTDYGFITFCSHWVNRNIHDSTQYDDFKVIIAYRVDNDSTGSGAWMHSSNNGVVSNLKSDNSNILDENKPSPFFFIQRNLVQGTIDEKTYDDFLGYKGTENDDSWFKQTYGLQKDKKNVLTFETLSQDVRGRGELSVLPKNPIVWTDESGNKSIVYLGGNFGNYRSNSKVSTSFNNNKYLFRQPGLNLGTLWTRENPKAVFSGKTVPYDNWLEAWKWVKVYNVFRSENSHGRLIKFNAKKIWNTTSGSYNTANEIFWEYLGYPVANDKDDVYKDFSTEIVVDKNNDLHFVASRSVRSHEEQEEKIEKKADIPGNDNKSSGDSPLRYKMVGSLATNSEIDKLELQNPDNFMWVKYSEKLSSRIPEANFNDKYIYEVMSSLALIMNFEFGIENDNPFFRKKHNYKNLTATNGLSSTDTSTVTDFTNYKLHCIGKEIIYRNSSFLRRGLFGTTAATHVNNSRIYLISLLANEDNIVDISNYKLDYDFIYNEITGVLNYYSVSKKEVIEHRINRKIDYQNNYSKNLTLPLPFINDTNWADIIISRYASILSTNNQILNITLKYSPFLKSGEHIVVKNNDFNIDYQLFNVLSANHDLKGFTTNIKAKSVVNPLLHLTS